jgi:hypothetical protein
MENTTVMYTTIKIYYMDFETRFKTPIFLK